MSRPTLRNGDNDNNDVRLLQQLLRDMNYDVGGIDGDFGSRTEGALRQFQDDYDIHGEGGEAGPKTWEALEDRFGDLDGIRAPERVADFVEDAYGDIHQSGDIDVQLQQLAVHANEQLASVSVPYVPFQFGSLSDWAEFNWATWTITVDRARFQAEQEAGNAVENMNTVYHEARHAEQLWMIGRLLAGAYGMDAAAITTETGLRSDIAALAAADPILESTSHTADALRWYEEQFGVIPVPAGLDVAIQADAQSTAGDMVQAVDDYVSGGAADGRRILVRGSGDASEVRYLQELLEWRDASPGAIDGDFGTLTEEAVKRFQRAQGLDDDGKVGRMTWEALLP